MIQCQAELIKRLDINIILTYDEKVLENFKNDMTLWEV